MSCINLASSYLCIRGCFLDDQSLSWYVHMYVLVAIRDSGIRAKYTHREHNVQLFIYTQVVNIFYERSVKHTDKVSSYARHAPRDRVITTSQFSIKEDSIRLRLQFFSHVAQSAHTEPHHPPSWMHLLIIVPRTIYLLSSPNRSTHNWISIIRLVIYNRRKVRRSCELSRTMGPVAGVCGSGYFMSRGTFTRIEEVR